MGNGVIFIVIVIGIIVLVGIYQKGFEGFKTNPTQSSLDATKTIYDKGKDTINYLQSKTSNSSKSLTEVGKIPCAINQDCNVLEQCANNLCTCKEGSCWK